MSGGAMRERFSDTGEALMAQLRRQRVSHNTLVRVEAYLGAIMREHRAALSSPETTRVCAQRLREYLDHRVGCDATWRNGVRRKFPDQGECGCGLNDLLNQPLSSPETTPAGVLDEAALRVAAWRLSNAAASLARHAQSADDPAHRSWFPSAIGDVLREVDLARQAAGIEPDAAEYAAALGRSGSGGGRG